MTTLGTILLGLFSGLGGSLVIYWWTNLKSQKECRKAVLKELEYGLYKAHSIVLGLRKNRHVSFKAIELQIYPAAIIRHPALFNDNEVYYLLTCLKKILPLKCQDYLKRIWKK